MSASARGTLAAGAARRLYLQQVRGAVRDQLAASQRRRRQELAQALAALHGQLLQIRTDTRARLREISEDAAARRAAKRVPPGNAQ